MRGTVIHRFWLGAKDLLRDQRGNTMFLTAAAVVPLIGFVGSAVDIGRAYMAELRLQQACDAGVLAGRRAMAGGTYDSVAQAEAKKMFNFNFPDASYGSSGVRFVSEASGASDVAGTASAVLPTALMYIFGKDDFNLSVNCTAKLEISNVDVMLVLDVTGSMSRANGDDDVTKIEGLRTAAIDFFGTLTDADIGDGRLRFGVVPYSSSVNVGGILMAKNPDWLSDIDWLPTRKAVFRKEYADPTTDVSDEYTDGPITTDRDWSTQKGSISGVKNSSECEDLVPDPDAPRPDGSPDYNKTGVYESGETRVTTYRTEQDYIYRGQQRYVWSNKKCRLQYKNSYFTRTYTTTVTETMTDVFDNKYQYKDFKFDVSRAKLGEPLESDTGDEGTDVSTTWQGCIIERYTTPFGATETAPAEAYDMDIDMEPTNSGAEADDTKWKLFLPAVTFDRGQKGSFISSSDYKNFAEKGGDYAACPVPAMNLTEMTKDDASTFASYINSLQPKGYTYHDAGMAWGARLMSPTGLFKAENATAANGRPISRHIIFMTDGDMMTPRSNLSHQGQESSMPRIGATSDDNAIARHNNRFVQLCKAARDRGITLWVVSFGVGSNSNLNKCASSGAAYEADDSDELNENFQSIARQISKLRLSR
jgi:Flp pilus assembly protein TadG